MKSYLLVFYLSIFSLYFDYSNSATIKLSESATTTTTVSPSSCANQKSDLYSCLSKCGRNVNIFCLQSKCSKVANSYSICKNNRPITISSAIKHLSCLFSRFDAAVKCSNSNRCSNVTCIQENCDNKMDAVFDCFL